jgi:hypothetical protein
MTLTTDVRINWPVAAERLLDHVTTVAGGDPKTIARGAVGYVDNAVGIRNLAGQGLRTLALVYWSEQQMTRETWLDGRPEPPAVVVLSIDNPYGTAAESGRSVHANEILPAVAEWLDAEGVPRTAWWWNDETADTWHPGTFDVRNLNTNEPRPVWTHKIASR